MGWGPQITQGIAKIRGEVAWTLARALLILLHRGQTLTHCPASKEKGFYSTFDSCRTAQLWGWRSFLLS